MPRRARWARRVAGVARGAGEGVEAPRGGSGLHLGFVAPIGRRRACMLPCRSRRRLAGPQGRKIDLVQADELKAGLIGHGALTWSQPVGPSLSTRAYSPSLVREAASPSLLFTALSHARALSRHSQAVARTTSSSCRSCWRNSSSPTSRASTLPMGRRELAIEDAAASLEGACWRGGGSADN